MLQKNVAQDATLVCVASNIGRVRPPHIAFVIKHNSSTRIMAVEPELSNIPQDSPICYATALHLPSASREARANMKWYSNSVKFRDALNQVSKRTQKVRPDRLRYHLGDACFLSFWHHLHPGRYSSFLYKQYTLV
jgi:hypothetical protein